MNTITLILLALSMSVDAFAVTLAKGASCKHPSHSYIIKTALTFGIVEALTPLLGWWIGRASVQYIGAYDHWIAFILLSVLGVKMIRESLQPREIPNTPSTEMTQPLQTMSIIPIHPISSSHAHALNKHHALNCPSDCKCDNHSNQFNWLIIITAIATGIDSMVVGVTLAFMEANIILISLVIGLTTTVMAIIGIKLGHILGTAIGKRAEIFGGLVLIGIGLMILYDHLFNLN